MVYLKNSKPTWSATGSMCYGMDVLYLCRHTKDKKARPQSFGCSSRGRCYGSTGGRSSCSNSVRGTGATATAVVIVVIIPAVVQAKGHLFYFFVSVMHQKVQSLHGLTTQSKLSKQEQ